MKKFVDLFAGAGGFHLAFKDKAECVLVSENNAQALDTYRANFDLSQETYREVITKLTKNDIEKMMSLNPYDVVEIPIVEKFIEC